MKSESELKRIYIKLQRFMTVGAEMGEVRQLADKCPDDMEPEAYQSALGKAGAIMRERQAEIDKLQKHALNLRQDDNHVVATNLHSAAGAIRFIICLSQRAYDHHLDPAQTFMRQAAESAGWE